MQLTGQRTFAMSPVTKFKKRRIDRVTPGFCVNPPPIRSLERKSIAGPEAGRTDWPLITGRRAALLSASGPSFATRRTHVRTRPDEFVRRQLAVAVFVQRL